MVDPFSKIKKRHPAVQKKCELDLPPAFIKWFQRVTQGNLAAGISVLFDMAKLGSSDSFIWDLLRATGDQAYDDETFAKAARILLEAKL